MKKKSKTISRKTVTNMQQIKNDCKEKTKVFETSDGDAK